MRHFRPWANAALAMAMLMGGLAPGQAVAQSLPPAPPPPAAPGGGSGPNFSIPIGCDTSSLQPTNTTAQAILDSTTITSTITVAGQGASLWLLSVNTDITHTAPGDLNITLFSPQGTAVSLSTGNGNSRDNFFHGTEWYDRAGQFNPPGPVTLFTYPPNGGVESPLAPEEPLAAFRGENPNGVWTLTVEDTGSGDEGSLESWGLNLVTLLSTAESVLSAYAETTTHEIPDDGTPFVFPFSIAQQYATLSEYTLTTHIAHAESDDLVIELVPPSGYTITLASGNGGLNADVFDGTEWNDKAGAINPPGPITDYQFSGDGVVTPLAPREPLAAATGQQSGGQWTLIVRDFDTNAITGTLTSMAFLGTSLFCRPNLSMAVQRPSLARMSAPMPVHFKVTNEGAYTTAPIQLTATLPISAAFISAGGPDWSCGGVGVGVMGGTLLCSRSNTLFSGETTTVTALFSPPAVPKELGDAEATVMTTGDDGPASASGNLRAAAISANKNPWDVVDNLLFPGGDDYGADTGGVDDGGQDAFDEWGDLRLRVFDGSGLLAATGVLEHFGLVYSAGHRWHTTTPVLTGTIQVARSLYAPADTDWLRYVDTFTNTSGSIRTVWVAWGGDLGSDNNTLSNASSSGDAIITAADTWATTIENDAPDPPGDAVLGYAWRSPADTTFQGPGIFTQGTFTTPWPSAGNEYLGYNFKLVLAPGASASLAYFVYRGLDEDDPGPDECERYGDCFQPAPGSQVALAQTNAAALAAQPNFCDLTPAEFAKIVNWPGKGACTVGVLYLPVLQR